MDFTEFRRAVRSLAMFTEDLWIQNEVHKDYVLQLNHADPGDWSLAETALQDQDEQASED
jgi:hypothetical protein